MTEENSNSNSNSNSNQSYGSEVGNVVWFDQKKGFGFVTIITPGSEFTGREIFVHYTSIKSHNNFKKLLPGENVSLNIVKNTSENNNGKEYISQNVTGLYGSRLLVDNEQYLMKVIRKRGNENSSETPAEESVTERSE